MYSNIGLIGKGVVGNALYHCFIKKNLNIIIYDKFKNIGKINDLLICDIIFICLPTLFNESSLSFDKNSFFEICNFLSINNFKNLIVIKSTLEPESSNLLSTTYNLNICHNPEFLSTSTALSDFENQSHIVLGISVNCNQLLFNQLFDFYKFHFPNSIISICTSNESELMKLAINNFYAVKIQFFNELFLLSQKINLTDFNNVKNMMLKNNWINPMHTNVPGNDGKLSYGGLCFPKDTNAFLHYLKNKNTLHSIIQATINEHNILRNND
jgi:UDP-glucose 6-dehydrogenase